LSSQIVMSAAVGELVGIIGLGASAH